MKNKSGKEIKLNSAKLNSVIDLLKGDKALYLNEISKETGVSKYIVSEIRSALERDGHHIKKKKRYNNKNGFKISDNSEADAIKKRKEEKKKRTEEDLAIEKIRQKLKELRYNREIEQIELEAAYGGA